jgi:hypothetical protein
MSAWTAQKTSFLFLFNCCLADRAENTIPLFASRSPVVYLAVAA